MTPIQAAAGAGSPARVTVVSEDPAFLEVATEVLESDGYIVTCLIAGPDVAARIVASRPDLLCTDTAAPDAAGDLVHLARWAREQPKLEGLPTLLLTSDGAVVRRALTGEGDMHTTRVLLKPVGLEPFLATVDDLLTGGAGTPVASDAVAFTVGGEPESSEPEPEPEEEESLAEAIESALDGLGAPAPQQLPS